MIGITKYNGKPGVKVKRGPAWTYREQDKNSEYGVICGYADTNLITVNWIDAKGYAVNSNLYPIPSKKSTPLDECVFVLYEETGKNEASEGEVVPVITTDNLKNWNNALELAIDTFNELKDHGKTIEKISSFLRNEPEEKKDK